MSEEKPIKRLNLKLLISALIISTFLFFGGVFTGYTISRVKLSSIEDNVMEIRKLVSNFQLQFLFFDVLGENSSCPLLSATLSDINKQSYDVGSRLTGYSSESEIQDYDDYSTLRKEYSRLLIGYWLLAKKLKATCEMDAKTIIYFFSRECIKCDDQGFILTYLKGKYNENLLIFALDSDIEDPSVETLKEFYNITEKTQPVMIIEGKVYKGFFTKEELEKILK